MTVEHPITIFIDNCINSLSDTMQGVIKEQKIVWGDIIQDVNVVGYERIPMLSEDQAWKNLQIQCLPTVERLAIEGKIELFTYNELINEAWKRPNSFPGNALGNLFAGITFKHVDAVVERSFFF